MQIRVKKINSWSKLPTRGSDYAAGYDLYADQSVTVSSGQTVLVGTGVALEIPEGYFGAVYARSGLATKQGLRPANCVGVIDSDYRGQVFVAVHNDNIEPEGYRSIEQGDRIAQLVIQKFEPAEFEEVEDLEETKRGEGGFGSTGKN